MHRRACYPSPLIISILLFPEYTYMPRVLFSSLSITEPTSPGAFTFSLAELSHQASLEAYSSQPTSRVGSARTELARSHCCMHRIQSQDQASKAFHCFVFAHTRTHKRRHKRHRKLQPLFSALNLSLSTSPRTHDLL
jgi:hypothetical protein